MPYFFERITRPIILAHRGDSKNFPENTIPAFESGIRQGADGIELDVRLSSDNEIMVYHLHGICNSKGVKIVEEKLREAALSVQ